MLQKVNRKGTGTPEALISLLQLGDVQRPVPFIVRVRIINKFVNKGGGNHQDGQRKTDPEKADEREELPALQYRYGYFKVIS